VTELAEGTARINFHVDDKIGLPNYSSVSYGISLTRDVPDTGSAADLKPYMEEIVAEVEAFAAEERSRIMDMVQGGSIAVETKGK
jgi:hypothetical protein